MNSMYDNDDFNNTSPPISLRLRHRVEASKEASPQILQQLLGAGISKGLLISTVLPWVTKRLSKYPRLTKMVLLPLAIAFAGPAILQALPSIWTYMVSYMMSNTVIAAQDSQLQKTFRNWLKKKLIRVPERSVTAQSPFHAGSFSNESVLFQDRNTFQFFRHNKRFFVVTSNGNGSDITIWTFGWTPQPIKDILVEITEEEERSIVQQTHILTAEHGNWMVQKTRSQRPLDTVFLPPSVKESLLRDIEEYLCPDTRKFYADRGIPYRRGYLLYGAPGCGKSSLAVALAGSLRTNVYSLSLLDPKMTDSLLMTLFQRLPPGCICLLEDVDSAGLGREISGQTSDKSGSPKRGMKGKSTTTSRVTLSGLLNAIDGASAPEGHLLLMTTNCPESLDEALIRAGMIDVKVEFKRADTTQIRQFFSQFYRSRASADISEARLQAIEKENEELATLADEFVRLVPEYRFSPAQLQDYFLLHKRSAKEAVDNVQAWIENEDLSKSTTAEKRADTVDEAEGEPVPRRRNLMRRKPKQSARPSSLGLASMGTGERFHTPPQTPAPAIAPAMGPEVLQEENHQSGEPPSEYLESYHDDDTDFQDWPRFIPQESWDALQAEAQARGRNFVPAR